MLMASPGMKSFQVLVRTAITVLYFLLIITSASASSQSVCVRDGANGADVVRTVIAELEYSDGDIEKPFDRPDHGFLRRLAYVETKDGTNYTDNDSYQMGGGIWGIDRGKLGSLQQAIISGESEILTDINDKIESDIRIAIDISQFNFYDIVKKPLHCGVTARFILHYLEITKNVDIPLARNITGQAHFWVTHYCVYDNTRRECTIEHFVERVHQLEWEEGCRVNVDLFFVLDLSNSVGKEDFEKMKIFQLEFVERLNIGRNHTQVGTIIFKSEANTTFHLNAHNTKESLMDAINSTHHNELGRTNIQDALCHLKRGFIGNGVRPLSSAVFRIAILMTDGVENTYEDECGFNSSIEAAKEIHSLSILLYVIGVTERVQEGHLEEIATLTGGNYNHIDDFDDLPSAREDFTQEMCRRASVSIDPIRVFNTTLEKNETYRYNLVIGVGVKVTVCVSHGSIEMYASTSVPSPNSINSEFHLYLDFETQTESSELCDDIVIDPDTLPTQVQCSSRTSQKSGRKRQMSTLGSNRQTVYFSIVGRSKENSFVLKSTSYKSSGDTINPSAKDKTAVVVVAATSTSGFLILITICFLIIITLYAIHRNKQKKKREREDEYRLLPQSPEYVEF